MRRTILSGLAMTVLALAAGCGSKTPRDQNELAIANDIGPIEGTINDLSAIELAPLGQAAPATPQSTAPVKPAQDAPTEPAVAEPTPSSGTETATP